MPRMDDHTPRLLLLPPDFVSVVSSFVVADDAVGFFVWSSSLFFRSIAYLISAMGNVETSPYTATAARLHHANHLSNLVPDDVIVSSSSPELSLIFFDVCWIGLETFSWTVWETFCFVLVETCRKDSDASLVVSFAARWANFWDSDNAAVVNFCVSSNVFLANVEAVVDACWAAFSANFCDSNNAFDVNFCVPSNVFFTTEDATFDPSVALFSAILVDALKSWFDKLVIPSTNVVEVEVSVEEDVLVVAPLLLLLLFLSLSFKCLLVLE